MTHDPTSTKDLNTRPKRARRGGGGCRGLGGGRGAIIGTVTIIAGLLVACEHARFWRGGEPYDDAFIIRMTDPEQERAELDRRMDVAPDPLPNKPDGSGRYDFDKEWMPMRSGGCMSCHGATDEPDMHPKSVQSIGCADCHGGDPSVHSPMAEPGRPGELGTPIEDAAYLDAMSRAHVQPRNPEAWYGNHDRPFGEHGEATDPARLHGSRNPEITGALLNQESPEFIRFINPGDLRVAEMSCGACHAEIVAKVKRSMMAHGAQLWGAALYNNGSIPNKIPAYGESYSAFGLPQRLQGVVAGVKWDGEAKRIKETVRRPTDEEMWKQGVLAFLEPLPVWNIAQPGNVLRIFERGTKLPVPGGPTPNAPPAEIGNPNPLGEGGRPDKGLSVRGLGTLNRTDPVFIGLQKTRLLDPILFFLGTNDHPGDYRSSGCTACHVVYANDGDPTASGSNLATRGNMGHSFSTDPTLPKNQPGHPVQHQFTSAIPSSQCIVCHIHPGTSYANTYLGYMWWDNESDGEFFYPNRSTPPTIEQERKGLEHNPESASLRGLWGNLHPDAVSHTGERAGDDFLERSGARRTGPDDPAAQTLNDRLKHNQIADFHGHGWIFRAVNQKDREGRLVTTVARLKDLKAKGLIKSDDPDLDEPITGADVYDTKRIEPDDPDKWVKAVHLRDVHLEKGMQCIDCHFEQDAHGDGKLYGEVRNAIAITCIDCHGTYDKQATLKTSGPAAPPGGTDFRSFPDARFPDSRPRITIHAKDKPAVPLSTRQALPPDAVFVQQSAVDPDLRWEIPQTVDTINPNSAWAQVNPEAAALSRRAKTIRTDGLTWGDLPKEGDGTEALAHSMDDMECYTCHTSWMTSCFGCHLPMEANRRAPMQHNENLYTRNYTRYNYQVLRDDVFMLGRDSTVKKGKIVPVRSSSAVVVSSQNANREWVYHQQQTISGEGYSGQAFNPHFPHATSGRGTTKMCTDCHLSRDNDNNAWMAQLLLQGTNFVNFLGRYVYVAEGGEGLEAVVVTEHDEPQAVFGSHLHELAYPDEYARFVNDKNRMLDEARHHDAGGGDGEILDVQLRGEYLYTARGTGGFYAFDVANVDNKGFSEPIVTAPVSPLGQRLGFDTKYAVAVAAPSTLAVDPVRTRLSNDPSQPRATILEDRQPHHVNEEQKVHPMYAYLYIADRDEGLILTSAATLLDGDPTNNFMERAVLEGGATAFNPDGLLSGMTNLALAGTHLYATSASGLVVIDIDNPLSPQKEAVVGTDVLTDPQAVAIQFRYAFVTDANGLKVLDVTDPKHPAPVAGAVVPLAEAHRLYVARTMCYVAAGSAGLALIDVTNPEKPTLQEMFTADGAINDARDVKVGMTNASLYAYVADGRNGLRVLQLMGPDTTAQFRGFAPPVSPRLIATYRTHGPALALSKGLDRDRAVDESGHQIAVFGRLGARPMNLEEMALLYLRDGKVWTVSDVPEMTEKILEFNVPATPTTQPSETPGGRQRRR